MALKQTLPIPAETAIATYNYTDVAEGTGIIVFFGSENKTGDAVSAYYLTQNVQYADTMLTEATGTSGTQKLLDLNFDLSPFNLPKNIKGVAKAIVPVIVGDDVTSNKGGTVYVVFKVRKWDGSTETEIASNTKSRITTNPTGTDSIQDVLVMEADITSVAHFKKGEVLRITIEVWANSQEGAGIRLALMHDPKNRAVTGYTNGTDTAEFITSILEFHIPFVLDI